MRKMNAYYFGSILATIKMRILEGITNNYGAMKKKRTVKLTVKKLIKWVRFQFMHQVKL